MKNKIYLVDIESIPNRYSCEWKTEFPQFLRTSLPEYDIVVIEGRENVPEAVTEGAFINFGGTNIYKSDQIAKLAELFTLDIINHDDHIIFADAWHPGIINVKYMCELLDKRVHLHGLWHAGSYDKWDFLGRIIGRKDWIIYAEQSFYSALDYNWFATEFHATMFFENNVELNNRKSHLTGWPMSYTSRKITAVNFNDKENIIVYPHRLAPEKRIDLFKSLANLPELANYKFVIPMELNLTKTEYHQLLQKSKFIISFAEQETLGISVFEGLCAGCMPIVPDRLSYTEIYPGWMKIKCDRERKLLDETSKLILQIDNQNSEIKNILSDRLAVETQFISKKYFTCGNLIDKIKNI